MGFVGRRCEWLETIVGTAAIRRWKAMQAMQVDKHSETNGHNVDDLSSIERGQVQIICRQPGSLVLISVMKYCKEESPASSSHGGGDTQRGGIGLDQPSQLPARLSDSETGNKKHVPVYR